MFYESSYNMCRKSTWYGKEWIKLQYLCDIIYGWPTIKFSLNANLLEVSFAKSFKKTLRKNESKTKENFIQTMSCQKSKCHG